MHRWIFLVTAALAVIHCRAGQAADGYELLIHAERASAIYEINEPAAFVVELTRNGQAVDDGEVTYRVDDFRPAGWTSEAFPQGILKLQESHKIVVTSSVPRFLRCQASVKDPDGQVFQATAGIGFSPESIRPGLPVPNDFDEFWANQKGELAKIPLNPHMVDVEQKDASIKCYDVKVDCIESSVVSGYFAKPKDAAARSLPAVLWVHGAGVRSSSISNAVKGASNGMLSMDINAHGIQNGQPNEFYQNLSEGRLKDYRYDGREDRERSYFRGMFLRLVRAIDFLTAQPEWDGKIVAVIGHSQGGGQALVAGGIDERVTFIATGVPAICDHAGMQAQRINGWPKLVPTNEKGQPDLTILEASRYVEAVNFASRCRADAIMSVGFIDAVCPPSSCYAAYNQLTGSKSIITEPLMGHAAPEHIQQAFFRAIQDHVQKQTTAKVHGGNAPISLTDDQTDKCLETLREGLHADEFWPSIHAAEALTLAGHEAEVREFLEPKLLTETDDQQLCGLARELVRAGDRSKAKLMINLLRKSDPYGHTHAAESLYKVNEIGDGDDLRRVMSETTDIKTRLMAAAAVARAGDQTAYNVLREALRSEDEQTIRNACWILARIGDSSDVPQLRADLAKVEDPLVKAYLEHALAALGDAAGLKALQENLSNPDPAIRTYAATFAGDAYAARTKGRLEELLDDENLDVRVRAAQSLLVMSQAR